jgi:diguanylate cyclase (GGDEF)-like protein/PAS domain S-box-containing protein
LVSWRLLALNERKAEMIRSILLVQNDVEGANAVLAALRSARDRTYDIEWVTTCALGLERLAVLGKQDLAAGGGLSAVLVDLSLPDAAGMEIVDRIYAADPQTPILILSSLHDESVAKAAIERGAQDFLLKERLNDYDLTKMLAAAIDRAAIAEARFEEQERARITLNSIGDAVITTDVDGRVTYLNSVAEKLTGWPEAEAIGRPLEEVFKIVNADTRKTVPNPMTLAANENKTVRLPPISVLMRRDGVEAAVEDSAAPIHDRRGRVTGAVMVFHDVSASRAITVKLAHLAQHDALTDLPNRTLLNDRMNQAIGMAQRHHAALALLYMDLDRFKQINDSLGHLVGDRLLQAVAMRLSECVRATDTVSRLGGDEFVILLPEVAHAEDAAVCADKLLQSVRRPYVIDEHEIRVTASVGIAIYPGDGAEVEALLRNADSAMYDAKSRGRNSYQFYAPEFNSGATMRQSLERALRQAIGRNELELYYQPIISLSTGAVAGAEALIRWNHPTLGVMLPSQFIPISEESGLIVPIGRWVLREACRQAKVWRDAGLPRFKLAANISPVELRSKDFVAGVDTILRETGFDPQSLELELTETLLMQDSKSTAEVLSTLKELGTRLALDDFGTGYASLSCVRRFPIDTLKIDQSFVRDLTTDAHDASVVSAVITMANGLHMGVVAEGVETLEQQRFLEDHKCAEAQGYRFSRPLSADAFAGFLRAPRPKPLRKSKKTAGFASDGIG